MYIAVAVSGHEAIAGPVYAVALAFDPQVSEPCYRYSDRRGASRTGALFSSTNPPPEAVERALPHTRMLCAARSVLPTTRLEVGRLAQTSVLRVIERLRVGGLLVHETRFTVLTSIPEKFPDEFPVCVTIKRGRCDWRTRIAEYTAAQEFAAHVRSVLAPAYPDYRFDEHLGYPTRLHKKLLKQLGPTPAHRGTHA